MSLLHALQKFEKARLEREIDLLNRINLLEKEVASLKGLKLPSVPSLAALLKDNTPELAVMNSSRTQANSIGTSQYITVTTVNTIVHETSCKF